jgi:hypothetical protein
MSTTDGKANERAHEEREELYYKIERLLSKAESLDPSNFWILETRWDANRLLQLCVAEEMKKEVEATAKDVPGHDQVLVYAPSSIMKGKGRLDKQKSAIVVRADGRCRSNVTIYELRAVRP